MAEERLFQRGTTLVRRLRLEPGEAVPWHRDPFHRITVVLCGDALAIEYRDGGESHRFEVTPGQADWDEPANRTHRGVNAGEQPYEEITSSSSTTPTQWRSRSTIASSRVSTRAPEGGAAIG